MEIFWFDIVGSVGVAMIIAAYFLLQTERLKSGQLFYSLLNTSGAALVIFSLYHNFNFSAFIVEFFWLLISMYGLGKYWLGKT